MEKNLIIQLARFGDILQSRRLIKSVQQEGDVALCVDKTQERLARHAYPDIEIIPLSAFHADKSAILAETQKTFEYIQNEKYNTVYTMNSTGLSYAMASLFDPSQVRGYIFKNGAELRSEWVRFAFKYMQNRFQSPLHIMDYWGFLADKPIKAENVNPSAYDAMVKWQESKGHFKVGIVLSGQNARRSVPLASMMQIIRILAQRFDKVDFILLGTSANEVALAKECMVKLPANIAAMIENKVGKTNIIQLFETIKECDLILSPDTGALHCAAFLGVPTLSFFCSSAFVFETGAYGLGHTCVQSSLQCAPCTEAMPCSHVSCVHAFSSPSLLARLAGANTQKKIEDYAFLESYFDSTGLNYKLKEGELKDRAIAKNLRALLYEYRYGKVKLAHSNEIEELAAQIYDTPSYSFPIQKP